MEKYNFVNESNYIVPNYDISGRKPFITLYFNNDGDMITVGNVDNNYIYWLSITSTEDLFYNEHIFNYAASGKIKGVTNLYKALELAGISHKELKEYYAAQIKPAAAEGMLWDTPFGHFYGKDNVCQHGMFFARSVKGFLKSLHNKCSVREAGGMYERVLESYVEELKTLKEYNYRVRIIDELLKSEAYLCLSENENVRKLYGRCCDLCGGLYNAYMTAVR